MRRKYIHVYRDDVVSPEEKRYAFYVANNKWKQIAQADETKQSERQKPKQPKLQANNHKHQISHHLSEIEKLITSTERRDIREKEASDIGCSLLKLSIHFMTQRTQNLMINNDDRNEEKIKQYTMILIFYKMINVIN